MIFKRKVSGLLLLASALVIYGCGGDSAQVSTNEGANPDDSGGLLAAEPAEELVRNSLLRYYAASGVDNGGGAGNDFGDSVTAVAESAPLAADSSADSTGSSRFSSTNVQEEGVDESDRIKIDGNVLYALETPDFYYSDYDAPVPVDFLIDTADSLPYYQPALETLSAYRLDAGNSTVISRMQLQELRGRSVSGMYLYKNNNDTDLILLSGESFYPWESWGSPDAFGGLETRLSWIDASDPGALSTKRTMDIQGHLISSRRVGNRLILVTRFHPQIDGVAYAYTDADIERNRDIIANAESSEFLPIVNISEGGSATQRPVISSNLCYTTTSTSDSTNANSVADTSYYYPSPSVISIISVDLDNLSSGINSACFVGESETLYVSTESVYLATTKYNYSFFGTDAVMTSDVEPALVDNSIDLVRPVEPIHASPEIETSIHKFSFSGNGAPVFKGSGSVKGHLGWNPDRKPFRFSEKDNNLRVVTFNEALQESPVTLSILQESGGRLTAISTLPNESRPSPLGKPGESLYASRFIGDKGYLVTFRITDPLYVLDLSNPRDPRIAGELEIPGYSDYLHPVNENLLLGLGKDAVEASDIFGDGRGAWYQGVKLALYDVSDPANPFVADERIYGKRGTESPALTQHHSFAFLNGNGDRNFRMSIPLALHDSNSNLGLQSWAPWDSNNLLSVEVDEDNDRFVDVPAWQLESRSAGFQYSPVGLENDRAIIGADDELYFIHNGSLHYGPWGSSEPSLSISDQ